MSETVPFVGIREQTDRLRPQLEAAVGRVLDHGRFVMGPEVEELEQALVDWSGAEWAVGLGSGTDALLVALMVEEIGPGDAVFLPTFTFTATAEAVLLVGAHPVFVDVDEQTFNIDLDSLETAIERQKAESDARPRAILAVDLFGLPADYPPLTKLAEREGLLLIDDAAQSFGATRDDQQVGALAPLTTTSFFPAKPLGGYGDGGALLGFGVARAEVARSVREHGQGTNRYDNVRIGLNARLDSLQAAMLLVKLPVFEEELASRERLAAAYDARLAGLVTLPPRVAGCRSAWAQYTIRVPHRERFREHLSASGIPTAVYYPKPMHLQPAYQGYGDGPGSLAVSEALSREVVSLPMSPYLSRAQIDRVCSSVERAVNCPDNRAVSTRNRRNVR